MLSWTDSFARHLAASGLKPGQRVSIWLPNCVESVVVLLACARNGYVCNPSLHQNYTVAEIRQLLERLDSRVLVTQPGYGSDRDDRNLEDSIAGLDDLTVISLELASGPGKRQGFSAPYADKASPEPCDDADRVMYLAFTSGTTGEPKGVLHSANTLLSNARAMVEDWHHDSSSVVLSLSPMSHHIGVVAVGQALVAGCELVVNDLPPQTDTVEWIEQTGATYIIGVPTHAIDVQALMRERGKSRLGKVSVFYMAGAPIPEETARRFLDMQITPQNVYGMTENSSHQYTLPADDVATIIGTCGRACHGFEVAIFDSENQDKPLSPGETGEIGSRGGCLMLGYFDNQTATERSFNAGGWFMSGDLGRFDNNDCLEIAGRVKDLIIRGGHNIHPANIEALAIRHGAVNKAAAVAVKDERLGEKVCLAVMLNSGHRLSGDEILRHLDESGLSKYDMPEYYLEATSFPLTASGKILKRELARQIDAGEEQPVAVRFRSRT